MTITWFNVVLACTGCGRQTVRPPKAPLTGDLQGVLTGGCKWCHADLKAVA